MTSSSLTFTQESTLPGISFVPSDSVNTGADPKNYAETGLLSFSTPGTVAILLSSDQEAEPEEINYSQLAIEHAEHIAEGKTSVEIAQWIGDKLNIPSWKAGEFHGERKVLSSPQTSGEIERLKKFVEVLGVSFTEMNQPSQNHPQYLLLDGYVQNALFGSANMSQVDARLNTFDTDWKEMGNVWSTSKEIYLLEKIGLDTKGNWFKLTGTVAAYGNGGVFESSGNLYASGSLDGHDVVRLWICHYDSGVRLDGASNARLCFLA